MITGTIETKGRKKNYEIKTAKEKRYDFIEQLISDSERDMTFPWRKMNISKAPKSLGMLEKNKAINRKSVYEVPDETAEYHGYNRLLLSCTALKEKYKDSRWGTYLQIKKMGGHVKKGEKSSSIMIFRPKGSLLTKYNRLTGKYEPVTKINEETGKEEAVRLRNQFIKASAVFNVEQTEGLVLPADDFSDIINKEEKNEIMEKILKNSEAKIIYDQDETGESFYRPSSDTIHLPRRELFKSLTDFYATASHEIAHSTGNKARLNRNQTGNMFSEDPDLLKKYAREELIAELASVFLQQDLGISFGEKQFKNHEAYLQSWNKELDYIKENKDEFMNVCKEAEKAAEYMKNMAKK